jgi:hypothetical protein
METFEAFFTSKVGMFIYVVLFVIFCFVMEHRTRLYKEKIEKAKNGMDDILRLTKNVTKNK